MNFLYLPASYQLGKTQGIGACIDAPHAILLKNSTTATLLEVNLAIQRAKNLGKQVHGILTSDTNLVYQWLKKTQGIGAMAKADVNLQNYQGCMFSHTVKLAGVPDYEIPVVVIPSPEHIQYDYKTQWLIKRLVTKLFDTKWLEIPKLDWQIGDPESNLLPFLALIERPECILMSIDIETTLQPMLDVLIADDSIAYKCPEGKTVVARTEGIAYVGRARTASGLKSKRTEVHAPLITCVGFTAIIKTAAGLVSKTVSIPMNSEQHRRWIAKLAASDVPKVLHNGRYDAMYMLRYNMPINNWVFDTYGMMHAWMVEMPRTLYFTAAFTLRNSVYWKDENVINPLEYNAKDCHYTAWACLALISEMPDWAHRNYVSNFKQVFPAITCALEGFKHDPAENDRLRNEYLAKIEADQTWWDTVVTPNFNVRSSQQVKTLMTKVLRTGIKTTAAGELQGIAHKHPLWRLIVDKLTTSREQLKAESTYMNIETFAGRVLYELDPFGTLTGRYASQASSFWCGAQIQNQPGYVKSIYIADEGYVVEAIDNSQAESRTTAYITGDTELIEAVENAPDFHTRNASLFFGIPEEELFRLKKGTPEERSLFDRYRNKIGKRVNHGANYNMHAHMLLTTMTPQGVIDAKHTLGLPSSYTLIDVANHLLNLFDATYSKIRSMEEGGYHRQVTDEIANTHCLTNPDGWVRFTFMRPQASKRDLNAVVAHKPQSWAVKIVNRSFFDAWYKYQLTENKCRFKAQVHDEIVFQVKPEHRDYVSAGISALMCRPNSYTAATSGLGVDGEMVIPNSPSPGGHRWSDTK